MGILDGLAGAAVAANPIVGGIFAAINSVLDRVIPDPAQRAQAALELAKLQDGKEARELDAAIRAQLAQTDIDKAEAESSDRFKSGWRPFIGWICGTALAWNFIVRPGVVAGMTIAGHPLTLPPADMTDLMPVLLGMLGLGTLRTVEKIKGAA